MTTLMIAPVVRLKLAEIVRDVLKARLADGSRECGEYLPVERKPMAELGVGREPIRQAIRLLETEGLIRVIPGSKRGAKILRSDIQRSRQEDERAPPQEYGSVC
jgi:GntR family transcriptional regulator, sialic acid-inducible nan operon repressor